MTTEKKKTTTKAADATVTPAPRSRVQTLVLEVPFVPTTKYAQREVHLTLNADQAAVLRGVLEGLQEQHAKADKGARRQVPVDDAQGAVAWLLDAIDAAPRT